MRTEWVKERKKDKIKTQLHYAKKGVITQEMEYVANKFDIVSSTMDFEMNMFICNLAPHRELAKPHSDSNTSQDPINENKWFKRDIIYPEDKRTE